MECTLVEVIFLASAHLLLLLSLVIHIDKC